MDEAMRCGDNAHLAEVTVFTEATGLCGARDRGRGREALDPGC